MRQHLLESTGFRGLRFCEAFALAVVPLYDGDGLGIPLQLQHLEGLAVPDLGGLDLLKLGGPLLHQPARRLLPLDGVQVPLDLCCAFVPPGRLQLLLMRQQHRAKLR